MTSTEPDDIECGQQDEAPQRIRLWRGEGSHGKPALSDETKGRWYTPYRLEAYGYARQNEGHLYYLDAARSETSDSRALAQLVSPDAAGRREHSPECPGCGTDVKPCPSCGTRLNLSQEFCFCGTRIPRFGDEEG